MKITNRLTCQHVTWLAEAAVRGHEVEIGSDEGTQTEYDAVFRDAQSLVAGMATHERHASGNGLLKQRRQVSTPSCWQFSGQTIEPRLCVDLPAKISRILSHRTETSQLNCGRLTQHVRTEN